MNRHDSPRQREVADPMVGKHHYMEERLVNIIRLYRSQGFVFETWMLVLEGRGVSRVLYPNMFPDEDEDHVADEENFPFKFSNHWKRAFFKRFNFSLRKVGARVNHKLSMDEWNSKMKTFHVETRDFQLTEMNDPIFGIAHPWWVFSNDQVPIYLSSKQIMTVEERGLNIVYDADGKDLDTKRFCTLNLC